MTFEIDRDLLVKDLKDLIETPSTVSYYDEIMPVIEKKAALYGYKVTYDRKRTAYITIPGEDTSKTVCLGAHLDTIGMIVRNVTKDGAITIRQLGGLNYSSLESENVLVHTRDGKSYSGMVICKSHSVHVFDDARTLNRDDESIQVILDQDIHSDKDVYALGIEHGDIISVDPRFQYTENGYVKSRHIDDKGAAACLFSLLAYLTKNNIKPKYNTLLAFPMYEEIGHGGAYVPSEVSEYVALDIGLIGPDNHGDEYTCSICVADAYSPYDRGLTTKIINLAKQENIRYCVDIFYRYSTDANAAIRSGNNVYAAAFGMACRNSHGMERCHISALEETTKLALAYVLAE